MRDSFGVRESNETFRRNSLQGAQVRVAAQLRSAGFNDAEEFERALFDFLASFQDVAVVIAMELLAQFEQVLQREHTRYQDGSAVAALYQALRQTRAKEYYAQVVTPRARPARSGLNPSCIDTCRVNSR
ncbi:hypothetical protein [Cystobacter fuscus]|uniref:hypothetical protein n=1 Tax=Cystobacter fuscus TaxID=43 RepID=UPI0012DDE2D9|nr:hypothetical protein [Cystobacter fuscus]